ncbi:hypothetical protein [Winogradskyella sp. PE311]|uniref:hypothetical protein n=1 Tax=Winogradskyella sp. PE311 TaxID=3366943 RepID=UPI00398187FF
MKKFLRQVAYGAFFFVLINLIILVIYEYPAYKAIKNKTHKNYLKWEDIHSNKNTYDIIILGSSRSYTAFNPKIIDEGLQLKSYNMGTSAQDIAESYYALKEVIDYQKPKFVILDLFLPSSDDSHDFYQIFSNASFFKSTKNKFDLVIDGYGKNGILNYTVPLMKYNNYIKKDLTFALSQSKKKKNLNKRWIRGFLYDTTIVNNDAINSFKPISNFDNTIFNQKRFNYFFDKIHKLAESNNIKLICTRTPYPPSRLKLTNNNDENSYFKTSMRAKGVSYYDLNSYKNHIYTYIDQDFSDYHHSNVRGAIKASKQLIDIIKEKY